MKLSTTYSGTTWEHVRKQLGAAVEAVNGKSAAGWPATSNAQALAIATAFRKMLRAHKETVPSSVWPELWYLALGRAQPGDKFIMTTQHAAAPAPIVVVEALWEFVSHAATRLDMKRAKPVLLVLDLSWRGYEAAAAEAWKQLKRDSAKAPPIPKLPDKPPIDPPLPVVPRPKLRDAGILLLLLVVAFSTRRRR